MFPLIRHAGLPVRRLLTGRRLCRRPARRPRVGAYRQNSPSKPQKLGLATADRCGKIGGKGKRQGQCKPGGGKNVSNFKILCVEDSRETQQMLTFVLAKAGYEVITADNGQQGLEKAKAWRPALILVDMMMPRMSGADFIRRLRTDLVNKDVPVLVLSAYDDKALIEEAREAGADGYLIKTIPIEELLQVIDDHLKVGQTLLTQRNSSLHRHRREKFDFRK